MNNDNNDNDILFNVFMIGLCLGSLLAVLLYVAIEAHYKAESQRQRIVLPSED
jgi:hypothetical protein